MKLLHIVPCIMGSFQYTYTYKHLQTQTHTHTHTHTNTHTHNTNTQTNTNTHTHTQHKHTNKHKHTQTHINKQKHIQTHTNTHKHIQQQQHIQPVYINKGKTNNYSILRLPSGKSHLHMKCLNKGWTSPNTVGRALSRDVDILGTSKDRLPGRSDESRGL